MAVDSRNFFDHLKNEGGVDIFAEDKRLGELKGATAKTSSQISTTAQYIPLQDTDGNIVKINPSSFEEAVRNVLGSLLANNDKGTTISGVPALSGSGASLDFGSITPANLASVLGGAKQVNNPTKLKKAYSEVTYGTISNTTTDSPCAYGLYLVFPTRNPNAASNNGFILVFPHDANTIYLNVSWDSSGYYSNWRKVSLTVVTQ